jgi:hypothetical protein
MIRLLTHGELETIWKDAFMAECKADTIILEEFTKNTKNLDIS